MNNKEKVFFNLFKIIRTNKTLLFKRLELIKLIHKPSNYICECLHFANKLVCQVDVFSLFLFINLIIHWCSWHYTLQVILLKLNWYSFIIFDQAFFIILFRICFNILFIWLFKSWPKYLANVMNWMCFFLKNLLDEKCKYLILKRGHMFSYSPTVAFHLICSS